jgi:hypothetical protein
VSFGGRGSLIIEMRGRVATSWLQRGEPVQRTLWVVLACLCTLAALLTARGLLGVARAGSDTPTFVQEESAHAGSVASLALSPAGNVSSGNTLILEVGVWSANDATAATVTDSAGNVYKELLHFTASDGTEMSVWAAQVTSGGGTRPLITVKPSARADVGVVALEYAGVASVSEAGTVDQRAFSTGTTTVAQAVTAGATLATHEANELAIGMYLDSGFGDKLAGGAGYTTRANVSPEGDIELLAQDAVVASGATPDPSFTTGAKTIWLASTIVLKAAESGPTTVPATPTAVAAVAGNGTASVTWTPPAGGNSPITSYTVTPYIASSAQSPTVVTGSPPPASATIKGLTNGTTYTFTVAATNAVGTGPVSGESNPITPVSKPEGEWTPLESWPFVAIHLFQLADGNVLAFDGWQQPEPTYVWNPTTKAFTSTDAPDSIFCSGMAQLPSGEVMTVGGYGGLTTGNIGIVDTAVFNPVTGTWRRVADMHTPRWYPDVTELPNGDYIAISGNSTNANTWADTPEVYDPSASTWTPLPKVSTSQVHEEEYPFSYLLPSGEIFTIGPSEDVSYELNVAKETWTATGGSSGITNGSSVMYRPGKILYSGGAPSVIKTTNASATTAVIDLTSPTPKWRTTAPMHQARIYHTLTMLANGEVLATGGEPTSDQEIVTSGVLPTEIWNPATEQWSQGAPIAAARNYHSTAMLMADGRVLLTGGGHPNGLSNAGEFSSQIYSPPYLFDGPRPTITSAPRSATYGANITVETPDAASIASVNLVSLGTDTHQGDMAQHFVPLSFTANAGSLTVQMPAGPALAPYGNYMLFIVNGKGVPSVSAPVNITAAPAVPSAPTAVSATGGDGTATVSWTPPSPGTSPITGYTVTPYIGSVAQTATKVEGTPPATSAVIGGLKDGTSYTFVVTATNAVGSGPPSSPSNPVTPTAPTAPAAPNGLTAVAGNASAKLTWMAPASNGDPITGYTITPYTGTTALTPTRVSGSPPAPSATIEGLSNGVTYTFTVTATNLIGAGPPSIASNPVTPTATASPQYVQEASGDAHNVKSLAVTPGLAPAAGDRLVVEVAVWSAAKATASKVTDAAGDAFTEILHFKASDGTEMSVWTAPVTVGAGKGTVITATASAAADVGVAAIEYAGLSTAAGSAAVDQSDDATGTTKAAAVVSTAATAPTTGSGELVVGLYADSGFNDALMGRMGFNGRVDLSPNETMELVAEDALTGATGARPAASVQTGASTIWLMATVVFKAAATAQTARAPAGAPANVRATPADGAAVVSWNAPPNGGSRITSYTVTPYDASRRLRATIASGTSAAIPGLQNGRRYRFTVVARNALGAGPVSAPTTAIAPSPSLLWATWCTPFTMANTPAGPVVSSLTAGKVTDSGGYRVIDSRL